MSAIIANRNVNKSTTVMNAIYAETGMDINQIAHYLQYNASSAIVGGQFDD